MKLYQHIVLDPDSQELLHSSLPSSIELVTDRKEDAVGRRRELFSDCEIAFGNIPADWLKDTGKLKWLQLESVGFDPYLQVMPEYNKRGVMTNLHGFFGQPVAESALAGILALNRGIDELALLKKNKEWKGGQLRSGLRLLQGAEVLIVGGGNIGQTFKKILSGFDVDITVYDKNPASGDITSPEDLEKQMHRSDILFSCLPDCDETKSFFNEHRLGLLSESAIFVNVGRGTVVDEKVLVRLLKEGRIGGAVLDVTIDEPIPATDALWDCPNTIITQHTGGGSKDELRGKVRLFLDNLDLYLSGKTLKRIVAL